MARDPEGGIFQSSTVDEQTKAQAMRAAAPKTTTKPPTNDAEMIAAANALKARLEESVGKLESAAKTDIYGNPVIDPNSVEGRKAKVAADVAAAQEATPKPELTAQQIADGFIIKWIGTTNGRWQVIAPSAAEIKAKREAAENADYSGSGTAEDPFLYKGKPFTGSKGVADYVNGILKDGGSRPSAPKTYTASDGKEFTDQQAYVDYEISLRDANNQTSLIASQNKAERRSAYDLLLSEFKQYGLDALVTPLKSLIEEGVSPSEFTLRLRETDAYKKRFAANAQRVAKGLRALSEAEYIGTEDQYQDVMRRYGMPESYYTKGELGIQSGFEKFLAGDVSAVELEDRIQTAQNRVVNSNPEVAKALKQFYPGISNGDILAYVLDPTNAIEQIKRKVTAAEIGGAAIQSGLKTGMARAEELAAAGVTKTKAQEGFQDVAEYSQRGGVLAEIYNQDPYTQTTAEQEVFKLGGSVDATKQRKKLKGLEEAAFSGSAGMGAIARDRAGAY
jgi:hypothetical protein